MKIRIVLSGRGYDAADTVPAELELPDGGTIDDALRSINERLPSDRQLPATCLIAVAGAHVGTVGQHTDRELTDGDEFVLIAPVAGG